ncbi:unnamed protein product [Hapterophycus canaliculatus]
MVCMRKMKNKCDLTATGSLPVATPWQSLGCMPGWQRRFISILPGVIRFGSIWYKGVANTYVMCYALGVQIVVFRCNIMMTCGERRESVIGTSQMVCFQAALRAVGIMFVRFLLDRTCAPKTRETVFKKKT